MPSLLCDEFFSLRFGIKIALPATMENQVSKPEKILDIQLGKNGPFPNNDKLPLLIYKKAFNLGDGAADFIRTTISENNWGNGWDDGIYDFHHFHSNAHEVLLVYTGTAKVMFGGPEGKIIYLEKGDVAILPAGTTHKKLESGRNFGCVGAYPAGQSYDMHKGDEQEFGQARVNIGRVSIPDQDPVYGTEGPLFDYWKKSD